MEELLLIAVGAALVNNVPTDNTFASAAAVIGDVVKENDASALQRAWGVLAIDYDKLCGTWSCSEKRAEGLWNFSQCCEWVCNGGRIYDRHCHHGRNSGEDRT